MASKQVPTGGIADLPWEEQKLRMNEMLTKLKAEIKEVRAIDKDLTRQFITLGTTINELKAKQRQRQMSESDDDECQQVYSVDV